jgi:2-epi-5-epi-valiolone synthase
VPTTLIGMVDTGVGIKQGFNFGYRKNVLGTFYPPIGVINDFTFLSTLTEKEFSCGIAEIIKIAVIRDGTLIHMLERSGGILLRSRFQHPTDLVLEILLRAEKAMIDELQPNLFETRRARLADFGHTFSQGLERVSRYTMRHGHAVALDMLLSTGVAVGRKLCSFAMFERLVRLYRAMGLPITSPLLQPDLLLASIHEARLHRAGDLNLVVPLDFGRAEYLQELDREELVHSLALMEEAADEPQLPAVAGAGV